MFWNEADKNGFKVLKKCFSFLTTCPGTLIFVFLIIFINASLFGTALYLEYVYHGTSVFDSSSFHNFFNLNITKHLTRIGFILGLIFISALSNIICLTSLTYNSIQYLNKKPYGFLKSLKVTLLKLHIVIPAAIILVLHRIDIFFSSINPQSISQALGEHIQGKKPVPLATMYTLESSLFFPLIVETNLSIIEILEMSKTMMIKQFGDSLYLNISYTKLKFVLFIIIASTFGFFVHYHFNLLPAIVVSYALILSTYTLIETVIFLFRACLFNFIKNRPTGPFTKLEIPLYFKN
ncbi:MAG: hypothetical protein ACJAZS_000665 [Alteromonas naphthalenivorans]|jgi:hypothetical protein